MKPVRIAHFGKFLPPVIGGMETSIFEICTNLAKFENLKIRLVGANTENKREHQRLSNSFETTKLACVKQVFSTPILRGVKKEIEDFEPDLVHLHLPNPYLSYFLKKPNKPLVITYHCEILTYPTLLKAYSPILNQTLESASRIIATSQQLIDHSPFLKTFKSKCTVVPLGIPKPATTQSQSAIEKIQNEHGAKLILFVGRLVPYKGLSDLISAMTSLDGKLLIAGSGPQREELERLTESQNLKSKVAFLGSVSDEELKNYFQASRVVALTSIDEREAFGMCLVEGLSYSRPLVTTKVPSGVQFVNRDGYSGLAAEVGDVSAIAAALTKLLNDSNLWTKFSQQAQKHFVDHFEIGAVVREYRKVYEEVLS